MIESYKADANEICIKCTDGHECQILMPTVVRKILEVSGQLIVMTGSGGNIVKNRNIYRISEEGKIVWQVQDPFEYRGIKSDSSAAFTYVGLNDKNILEGYSWHGFVYDIDFETGKLSSPVFTK